MEPVAWGEARIRHVAHADGPLWRRNRWETCLADEWYDDGGDVTPKGATIGLSAMRFNRFLNGAALASNTARAISVPLVALALACGSDKTVTAPTSQVLTVLGHGIVSDRYTGEIWVNGNVAYTTTWGSREALGNAVKIWDVSGNVPVLVDSLIVPGASTLGDVQTSDDGQLL